MKIINTKIKQTFKSFLFVSIIATGIATEADDTEVFASENISNNLLFVMDVSGSMRQKITTVTVNGVTTTSGGTPGVIDQPVTDSGSDASQLVLQEETETTGVQTNTDEELNFVPGNIVGVRYRFSRNTIPQGATIKSAYLRFRSTQDNSEATEIDIFVEDASATYADAIYGNNGNFKHDYYHSAYPTIVDRPEFGPVRWQPSSWSDNAWNNTADVTTLVQAIVDKGDWDSISGYDSSLAFKFVTQSGARNAYSRDYNEANSPELYIVYEKEVTNTTYQWVCVDPNPYRWSGCNWGGWRYQAQTNTYTYDDDVFTWAKNSDDDAEQAFSAPPLDVVTDETTLSFDSDKIIGLRFDLSSTSSTIPRNSVITNAYIQFTAAEAASDAAEINIQIENTGNSLVYGGSNPTIKQRNFDEEFQRDWVPGAWISGDSNFNQRTPDLTQQVQHVIDTADGEALGFRLFGSLGTRVASANDA